MSYLKKIGALFVSSALMASMLAGCGGSSSGSTGDSGSQAEGGDGNYNISIVFKTTSNEYTQYMMAGAEKAAAETGAVLDMKFHPSALKTEEGRAKFSSMIKTYFALGGLQTQINVLDNKVLLDAKAHPENYRDLIVRVWGFSTYFVSLPEAYQDHIIARSTLA